MAKAGMRRYGPQNDRGAQDKHSSDGSPVPEIQGKAKHTKENARPIIAGTQAPTMKVFHSNPHADKPISTAYSVMDTDLARDNLENDIPTADLQDL